MTELIEIELEFYQKVGDSHYPYFHMDVETAKTI